jgi:MurNAc alpha-1-phosphate uridylyltransferase
MPKPLVKVAGKALLDHVLDRLADAGVARAVVNVHYLAEQIERHVAARTAPRVTISDERGLLLDTGGGVVKALAHFGDEPFFTVNADTFWLDGRTPMLARLAAQWDARRMEALLLLHSTITAHGYDSRAMGDYYLAPDGCARWRERVGVAPFVFAGVTLCDRRLFEDAPQGAFSQLRLWNEAEARGRLYGLRHDGEFFHVGTPQALAETQAWFAGGGAPRRVME